MLNNIKNRLDIIEGYSNTINTNSIDISYSNTI